MFARTAEQAPAYIFLAFIFTYNNQVMHLSRDFVLTSLICAGLVSFISIPVAGALSDRFGRKRIYLIGSVLTGIYGFIYFALLNSLVPGLIVLAIILAFIPHDIMYGPQAALIAEGFTPRLRYSGTSIGYQLASLTAGGPAPIIATALLATYGSGYVIAGYIALCAVVSIIATALMPDYTGRDISQEHA
jgi:MFS family permease